MSGTANNDDKTNISYAQENHGWKPPKLMTIWQPRTGEKKITLADSDLPVGYQLWTGGTATHEEAVGAINKTNKRLEAEYGDIGTYWNPDTGIKYIVRFNKTSGKWEQIKDVNKPTEGVRTIGDSLPNSWKIWTGGLATGSDARDQIFKQAAAEGLRTGTPRVPEGRDVKQLTDTSVSMETLRRLHGKEPDDSDYWESNPDNVKKKRDEYVDDTYNETFGISNASRIPFGTKLFKY